jgi:hypothetical protein
VYPCVAISESNHTSTRSVGMFRPKVPAVTAAGAAVGTVPGGVLTAVLLLLPWSGRLGWAAGALAGLGPFLGYLATRSVGLPGDPGDVGDWGYWVGTVSLIIEAALIVLCVAALIASRRRSA